MSDFDFNIEDFADENSFLLAAAERQTNLNPNGEVIPLKTTQSQGEPKRTISLFSISDAAANSPLMKPDDALTDIYQRVGQDTIARGIAENGGVQTVLGDFANVSPIDFILKANSLPTSMPTYSAVSGGSGGVPPTGPIDPGGAVISSQGWAMPNDFSGTLSDSADFGPRVPPKTNGGQGSSFHKGLDLGGDTGDPIRATKGGTVTAAGYSGGAGNRISIDHGGGFVSKYFHLSAMHVKAGDKVMTNQVIGLCGATGNVSGAHLHFEIHKDGTAIDPAPLLGLA